MVVNDGKMSDEATAVAAALRVHRDALRAFVRARVPPHDVDDVTQMAAMRAIERAESLSDPERALSWLYRLHRNVIADMLRTRAARERLAEAAALEATANTSWGATTEPLAESSAYPLCGCSINQVSHLKPAYAAVLSLVDVGGATLAEAAARLGVSINNTTVRLHRARKALRKRLLEHCGVGSMRDCLDCRCGESACCAA